MAQQLSMLELAQQGNAEAIAALIDRSLLPKGITTSAALQGDCLEISLQSSQVPNQKAVVALIKKGMETLQVGAIKQVRILSLRGSSGIVAWNTEFELASEDSTQPPEPLSVQPAQPTSAVQSDRQSNSSHPSPQNSQSMTLSSANPLAQLKQRFQEYQDIIIRFLDESSGAVRCLATLTELLQIITRSKFSFTDLAASPTLRTLLDAIAEFSHTDRNGDLIISNISILQPGQAWQKARIHLITKVLFEAVEYDLPTTSYPDAIAIEVLDTAENLSTSKPSSPNLAESAQTQASSPSTEPQQDTILDEEPDERDRDSTLDPPAEAEKDEDDTLDSWFDELDATSSPQSDAPRQSVISNRTVSSLLDNSGISSTSSSKSTSTAQPTSSQTAIPKEEKVAPTSPPLARTPLTPSRDKRAAMTLDDLSSIDEFGDVQTGTQAGSNSAPASASNMRSETLDDFSAMW